MSAEAAAGSIVNLREPSAPAPVRLDLAQRLPAAFAAPTMDRAGGIC